MRPDQLKVRLVLARGGTSKGLYLHEGDLPERGLERDRLLARLMGSPDILQIDGLGGSRPITSKIAIIKASERPDADIDYTFAQVDISTGQVGYGGNCGNISSGVGPFAVDEGLVDISGDTALVRIYNTNTRKILIAEVPVQGGKAAVNGNFEIPGVPGTGAEIVMNWAATVGAKTGRLLPTGNVVDLIELEDGRSVHVTLCDAANPCLWVSGPDMDLCGDESIDEINSNKSVLAAVRELGAKAAVLAGMSQDWRSSISQTGAFPLCGFVSPPTAFSTINGKRVRADEMDVRVHLIFMGVMHESIAGTASVSLAAASRVPGSSVHALTQNFDTGVVRIGHPSGVTPSRVASSSSDDFPFVQFRDLGFSRTARRLMDGSAYVPVEVHADGA